MLVLHTDLDNTLIYSVRRNVDKEKTCVEYFNGKPLSYMLNTSIEKLSKVLKLEDSLVVPTTARTLSQFKRINLPNFKYSLVSNGGILLRDGEIDKDWYDYSLSLLEDCNDVLNDLKFILEHDSNIIDKVKFEDNLFLMAKSDEPENTVSVLKDYIGDNEKVSIYNLENKVYVSPRCIDKNSSISRFKSIVSSEFTILADDSAYNYSDCVDLFLTSDSTCNFSNVKYVDGYLSEEVLDLVLDWKNKYK